MIGAKPPEMTDAQHAEHVRDVTSAAPVFRSMARRKWKVWSVAKTR